MTLVRRITNALAALFLIGIFVAGGASPAHAASYFPITGSGSTWSQNALDQWRSNVARNYAMTINYNGVGSTSGRRDFIQGTVDFAISEIPFQANPQDGSAAENPTTGYAYMPIVAGGTSFMYNLKISGQRVTNLRLSGETIAKIFTGKITNWNDAAIKADNPGLAMPSKTIVPVIRSDGSGTSAQFTLWMSKQFPSIWTTGMTSQFPSFGNAKAQKGSDGTSGYVSQNYGEGAITYVEYSYARKAGFPVAKVLNKAGYYIEPTALSVAVAMTKAQINSDTASKDYLTQILDGVYNSTDPRTYPLSSYSYAIVPTQVAGIFNTDKGNTLSSFMRYVLCEGQQQADTLGYSPLPMNLVIAGSDQIKRIPGSGGTGIDTSKCNNPTFKAGDSPSNNVLAQTAPQPQACDKQGTTQCTTGTGGATASTPVTGTGSSGSTAKATTGSTTAAGATAGSNSTAAGGTGQSGTDGTNADGTTADGTSAAGAINGSGAASSPYTLTEDGTGTSRNLMLASAALLLGVVILPPLLSDKLKGGAKP
jgi:phosphate transport system substrate-binding protein